MSAQLELPLDGCRECARLARWRAHRAWMRVQGLQNYDPAPPEVCTDCGAQQEPEA